MYKSETQGMPFKELIFVRVHSQQIDKLRPPVFQLDPLRQALNEMTWSFKGMRQIKTTFLNVESTSIFNKGAIIQESKIGQIWEAEILYSTPVEPGIIIPMEPKDLKFKQKKNYINYSFQRNLFYSSPVQLFESFGYKPVSNIYLRNVQHWENKMKGIEVDLFPEQGYLQIIETFPGQIDQFSRYSAGQNLFKKIEQYLNSQEVEISKYTLLPEDFKTAVEDDEEEINLFS